MSCCVLISESEEKARRETEEQQGITAHKNPETPATKQDRGAEDDPGGVTGPSKESDQSVEKLKLQNGTSCYKD